MARTKRNPISTAGGHDLKVMREEFNALVSEMDDLKTQYAALLAKLDSNHAAATDHVATLACTAVEAKTVGVK